MPRCARISYAETAERKASPGGEAGATSVATDEVEGNSVVPTYGDNRQLRPHQSQLTLRQLPLQGKPFAPLFLRMKFERIGACLARWAAMSER